MHKRIGYRQNFDTIKRPRKQTGKFDVVENTPEQATPKKADKAPEIAPKQSSQQQTR